VTDSSVALSEWSDPIVEEVRRARARVWEAAGCDLAELGRRLRAEQAESGHVVLKAPETQNAKRAG